jgi:hypothetical protein
MRLKVLLILVKRPLVIISMGFMPSKKIMVIHRRNEAFHPKIILVI